jgi:hypothetical protein
MWPLFASTFSILLGIKLLSFLQYSTGMSFTHVILMTTISLGKEITSLSIFNLYFMSPSSFQ